jgi:para-aminobenzoate synthetase component I
MRASESGPYCATFHLKSAAFSGMAWPVPSLRQSPSSIPRPIALDLAPVEAAARLRHLPGLVFFDSSKPDDDDAISIVAAEPVAELRGNVLQNPAPLMAAVAARTAESGQDDGLPHGFAGGTVDYDGTYHFGIYENALIFRHRDQTWQEVGHLASRLAPEEPAAKPFTPEFRSAMPREEYLRIVRRAQDYIANGHIYQVNLSHRFSAPWPAGQADPWTFYEALRHYSPAPRAAYVALGERAVLSSSPELFLSMSGRSIRTRPIKGTRPRRSDPQADEKSALDLLTSPKEVAELLMITDLERNDLGQVCEFGSVCVPELLKLERHEQVFHLVSTVDGRLRPNVTQVGALRACLPGGSITGAPKKRAREIIAELEPVPRGLYTGAIGWFGFNGESQFSIAIRTMLVERNEAHFHVGAGIVADSVPEAEWQETLDKAAGILLAAERLERLRARF